MVHSGPRHICRSFWSASLSTTGLFAGWLPSLRCTHREDWKETFMSLKAEIATHRSLNVLWTFFPSLRIFTDCITGTGCKSCTVQFMGIEMGQGKGAGWEQLGQDLTRGYLLLRRAGPIPMCSGKTQLPQWKSCSSYQVGVSL